jgi:hypothetical protein
VLALGVSMIGIGVLCFIAANWQVLPSWLKIVMIIGSYLASVAAAYSLERRGKRIASGMSLLLSGFLLLGGMALMSQIFHIEGSLNGLLAAWLLAFAPTFLIVKNISIYILYEIAAIIYMNFIYFDYIDSTVNRNREAFFDIMTLVSPYQPTLLLILLAGVAWLIWKGRAMGQTADGPLIKKIFVGGATRRIFLSNFFLLNWFTWMCVMNSRSETILPYVFGVLVIGVVIGFMAKKLDASDLDWQGLLFTGVSGIALSFPFTWGRFSYYGGGGEHTAEAIASSIALGCYLIYRIVRRERGGGFSVFLFCALLARWYFDIFYSFMSKSLFFISGGVLMLLIAYAFRRWNKTGPVSAAGAAAAIAGDDDDED